jgi:hypothetical protein
MTDMWTYSATLREALTRYDLDGFSVIGRDGDVGKVHKATRDQPGGEHLVVNTGPLFFGKTVLIPAGVVSRIDVEQREVHADVSREEMRDAPEYDPERGLDDDLRSRINRYYGRSSGLDEASGLDQIRQEGPVKNTIHNLVQTLSVKLDSAARYSLYRDDAREDGYDDCAEVFDRLEQRDRDSIGELLRCLRQRLGGEAGRAQASSERSGER